MQSLSHAHNRRCIKQKSPEGDFCFIDLMLRFRKNFVAKKQKKKAKNKASVFIKKMKPLFAAPRRIEQGFVPAGRGKYDD
jgi:hypothetical protein